MYASAAASTRSRAGACRRVLRGQGRTGWSGPQWFGLGDRDLATHLIRTQMLDAGYPCPRSPRPWPTAEARGPAGADDRRPGRDPRRGGRAAGEQRSSRAAGHPFPGVVGTAASGGTARRIVFVGVETTTPAPGVLDAIEAADLLLLPPSNPVVSIGPILAVPGPGRGEGGAGHRTLDHRRRVRGMADACLAAIGVETSAAAVAEAVRRPARRLAGRRQRRRRRSGRRGDRRSLSRRPPAHARRRRGRRHGTCRARPRGITP